MRLQNYLRSIRNFIPSIWASLAACVCLAGFVLVPAGAQTTPQSSHELVLTVGKSLVVNSAANIERIAIGYGEIAEARAVGPKEILIDGKAPGETSLIIWQQGGNKLFFDVTVRPNTANLRTRLDTLRRQIQEQLPGQNIVANFENDSIFLSGTAKDLISVERATAIASTVGKVVNLLYVDVPPTDAQILLKVQFASVDRDKTTELGLNLISTGATNTIGRVTTGQFNPPVLTGPGGGQSPTVTLSDALNIFLFRRDLNLGATIKALQTRGLFEVLAEPNVLAINGKQASFLAGGEFPYPVLQGSGSLGTVTIAFREFGVRIDFLPVITPRGTIRLEVAPEVSALDFTAGLTVSGVTIPGLTTRRVQTEIELEGGQSFAIAGLLDRRLTETIEKVPVLSSIPLLGHLFQSKSANKQNTELLVIVTPEIVRPIPHGQALPHIENPVPLSGPDTVPRTPGMSVTGPVPATQPNQSIPLEQLLQSLRMQSTMKLEGKDLNLPTASAVPAVPALAAPAAPAPPPPPAPSPAPGQNSVK